MTIGDKIKTLRKDKGITLEEIAFELNTQKATIWKYENNHIKNIPMEKLKGLAKILETTVVYLIEEDCSKEKKTFNNADDIRSTIDNLQLAEKLWNMPHFEKVADLYIWLCENK